MGGVAAAPRAAGPHEPWAERVYLATLSVVAVCCELRPTVSGDAPHSPRVTKSLLEQPRSSSVLQLVTGCPLSWSLRRPGPLPQPVLFPMARHGPGVRARGAWLCSFGMSGLQLSTRALLYLLLFLSSTTCFLLLPLASDFSAWFDLPLQTETAGENASEIAFLCLSSVRSGCATPPGRNSARNGFPQSGRPHFMLLL